MLLLLTFAVPLLLLLFDDVVDDVEAPAVVALAPPVPDMRIADPTPPDNVALEPLPLFMLPPTPAAFNALLIATTSEFPMGCDPEIDVELPPRKVATVAKTINAIYFQLSSFYLI